MEPTNVLRLGLILNYSVFLYDICEDTEGARAISKKGFDDALYVIEGLNK